MTADAYSVDEAVEKTKKLFKKYLNHKKDPKKFSMLTFFMNDKIYGVPTPQIDVVELLVALAAKEADDFTIISIVPVEKGLVLTVENDDLCNEEFFQYQGEDWEPYQDG